MRFLAIFQTGKIRVLKTAILAIFGHFLAARFLAMRAEFRFNDLKRKSAKKLYKF